MSPVSGSGEVFLDARGGERIMRVTWHAEAAVVVLSLWRGNLCAGSFRLPVEEVPAFVEALRQGLDAAYDSAYDSAQAGPAQPGNTVSQAG